MTHYHPDPDHTPEGQIVAEPDGVAVLEHPLWQRDNVILTSVGIDIGSAGTQILFSRVHLRRQSVDLSSRYLVVDRETLFESPVSLTPYLGETLIDARALGELVDDAYAGANLHPDEIQTGVLILTGEALRRENAEPIARILAEKCGELVCATAGHHMEATLAAHGSGAVRQSYERGQRILNLDMGGGTTKLSVIDRGRIVSTAALHVGSRLMAVDARGVIERLEPAGRLHAARAGYDWRPGQTVNAAKLATVAEGMIDALTAALTQSAEHPAVRGLYLTDPVGGLTGVDGLLCSGGVAEYVYGRERREFGDLGPMLGRALRARIEAGVLPWPLLPDSRGIRSTALGCSEFTVQLSGNTGYLTAPERLLPRRNLRVLRPAFELGDEVEPEALAQAIRRHMLRLEVDPLEERLVLALHWRGAPRYRRLRAVAEGIARGWAARIERGLPLYVILDADVALNIGTILHEEFASACEVLVIDGLALWDFDSLDIGRLREPSLTLPVTIKSLVFGDMAHDLERGEAPPAAQTGNTAAPT